MQKDLKLNWAKSVDGWILLDRLNVIDIAFNDAFGVYVLWSGKKVVKIGSGRIRDEIQKDKTTREIAEQDGLMITWASVPTDMIKGVKKYLTTILKPETTGEEINLSITEISANTPWDEISLL